MEENFDEIIQKKEKYKKKKCKVEIVHIPKKYFCFDFDGCLIKENLNGDIYTDFVNVKYTGELGNSNFKILEVKTNVV